MDLGTEDFVAIRNLLYERTGLMFADNKRSFVESRVARRVKALGCACPRDYYRTLRYQDPNGKEFQALVDLVTTNETYFFRDYPQLECFANEALPRVAVAKRAAGNYSLNTWSACCSTGDEPYTLAIILDSCLDDFSRWQIRLQATDIDTQALEIAKKAEYHVRNIKEVVPEYLDKYFVSSSDKYVVKDRIRRMVSFQNMNLMDRDRMRRQRGFDFIFCRNALIYFDDASRKEVLAHFYDALLPGGFVFLGHSESVGRVTAAFEPVLMGGAIAYRKPSSIRSEEKGSR